MINETNLNYATEISTSKDEFFNCFGGVLYVLNLVNNLMWTKQEDMEKFLWEKTELIGNLFELSPGELQNGDILTIYSSGDMYLDWDDSEGLVHTAVYIENGLYWHKMGVEEAAIMKIDEILDVYDDYDFIGIRRLKRNKRNK